MNQSLHTTKEHNSKCFNGRNLAKNETRNQKGSITVYLLLMLALMMALLCTLIESGRVSAIQARLRSITYMAVDSAFAEYAQPLFDKYGVMLLWKDEAQTLETINQYLSSNLDIAGTEAGLDMDLYGMRLAGSSVSSVTWMTDHDGQEFRNQVESYMKYHLLDDFAETLLAESGLIEQGGKIRDVMSRLNESRELFLGVGNSAGKISGSVQKIKDLSENPKTLLEEMSSALTDFEAGDASAAERFSQKQAALKESKREISQEISALEEEQTNYQQQAAQAGEEIAAIRAESNLNDGELDPELQSALSQRLSEMESGLSSEHLQSMETGTMAVGTYKDCLGQMDSFLQQTDAPLTSENLAFYQEQVAAQKAQLNNVDLSVLPGGANQSSGEAVDLSFVSDVNERFQQDPLALINELISDKKVDTKDFPSQTVGKTAADDAGDEEDNFAEKTIDKAMFSIYVTDHFGNFTDVREDAPLAYEAEYVLGGKDNDRDNLRSVVTKILLLRAGANLVSLFLDTTKQTEIQELAIAIAAAIGQVAWAKVIEAVLMFIWAMAESMVDVYLLLVGKKVPILKTADDWSVSLENLTQNSGETANAKEFDTGLSYENYLQLLLLTQNRHKQTYRTMDLIQADMCAHENADFRMKDSIVGLEAEVSYQASHVFTAFPFVKKSVGENGSAYTFSMTQTYAYEMGG